MRTLVLMATSLVAVEETSSNKKEWAIEKKLNLGKRQVQQQAVFIAIFAICSSVSVFICMQHIIIHIYMQHIFHTQNSWHGETENIWLDVDERRKMTQSLVI